VSKPKQLARAAAAWICIVAVVFLYAPLAGAALLAHGMDCCTGDYCPIKEHHHNHGKPQGAKAAHQHEAAADCDHDGHGLAGMTACSMSCCQDTARPAVNPAAFVLPTPVFVPATREVVRPVQIVSVQKVSRLAKPLSPPPRLASPLL
jgi:hypothetical protein